MGPGPRGAPRRCGSGNIDAGPRPARHHPVPPHLSVRAGALAEPLAADGVDFVHEDDAWLVLPCIAAAGAGAGAGAAGQGRVSAGAWCLLAHLHATAGRFGPLAPAPRPPPPEHLPNDSCRLPNVLVHHTRRHHLRQRGGAAGGNVKGGGRGPPSPSAAQPRCPAVLPQRAQRALRKLASMLEAMALASSVLPAGCRGLCEVGVAVRGSMRRATARPAAGHRSRSQVPIPAPATHPCRAGRRAARRWVA